MNDSQVYLDGRYTYKLPGDLRVSVAIKDDPYDLSPGTLFSMAARRNEKRSFLFVSKVLGKHIPLSPYVPLLTSALLAARYMSLTHRVESAYADRLANGLRTDQNLEDVYNVVSSDPFHVSESLLFIGFAETATALGHAMFDNFRGDHHYVHTTREVIPNMQTALEFSEEHSHAVAHYVYTQSKGLVESDCPVILIDDEMTSGKTSLNIIRSIQAQYPRKKYAVVSILDWRSESDESKFRSLEEELGIKIDTIYLMRGEMEAHGQPSLEVTEEASRPAIIPQFHTVSLASHLPNEKQNEHGYISFTGRFGIHSNDIPAITDYTHKCAAALASCLEKGRTLCLGTGELMYLPMRIACALGENVLYQSTTRSPVYPSSEESYAVRTAASYESPEHPGVINYLYNIAPGRYDNICVFFERPVDADRMLLMQQVLERTGSRNVYFITLAR